MDEGALEVLGYSTVHWGRRDRQRVYMCGFEVLCS